MQELSESIEQAEPVLVDLNQLVMKCYLNSQVTLFANSIGSKYLELEIDRQRYHWHDILQDNEDLYLKLKKIWTPESACYEVLSHLSSNFVYQQHWLQVFGVGD